MAKEKHIQTKGRIEDVPPWCYMKPGMTPKSHTTEQKGLIE